jgi:hypothetical protein
MPQIPRELLNRWLFELAVEIHAQPELNQAGYSMATRDRARQLLQLFVAAARSAAPIDTRLTLYVAWGLKSRDPARSLGLKLPHPGGTGNPKMTDAEREEDAELLAQRIAEEEGTRGAKKRGSPHAGDSGSIRERVINQFSMSFPDMEEFALTLEEFEAKHRGDDERGISTRTVEDMLKERDERRGGEQRLTGEIPYPGPSTADALPVPEGVPLDPVSLVGLLDTRGVLKRWLPNEE